MLPQVVVGEALFRHTGSHQLNYASQPGEPQVLLRAITMTVYQMTAVASIEENRGVNVDIDAVDAASNAAHVGDKPASEDVLINSEEVKFIR